MKFFYGLRRKFLLWRLRKNKLLQEKAREDLYKLAEDNIKLSQKVMQASLKITGEK